MLVLICILKNQHQKNQFLLVKAAINSTIILFQSRLTTIHNYLKMSLILFFAVFVRHIPLDNRPAKKQHFSSY